MRHPDLYQQVQLGAKLIGKYVYFVHQTPAEARLCTTLHSDGSVEIQGMTGQFAPHLFAIKQMDEQS